MIESINFTRAANGWIVQILERDFEEQPKCRVYVSHRENFKEASLDIAVLAEL